MQLSKDKTKILLVSYFAFATKTDNGPGAPAILQYFIPKVKKVVLIEHPFPYSRDQHSYLSVFEEGKLTYEKALRVPEGPDFIKYLIHFLNGIYLFLLTKTSYHLCIGFGNFSLLPIMPFKYIGLLKKVIYYTFDYMPNRFKSPLLNKVYFLTDQIAYRLSDTNWVVNKFANQNRLKAGFNITKIKKAQTVPLGYDNKLIQNYLPKKINLFTLIYSGGLLETSGIQLIIKALPQIIKKYPQVVLNITGSGRYESTLRDHIKNLKLEKKVKFLGFIENFNNLIKLAGSSTIGLAPYTPDPKSHTQYADPSKVKFYLSCSVPVITTKVAPIYPEIEKYKSGVVINYDEKSLFKAVDYLLSNKRRFQQYKQNALNHSKLYDINSIMEKALKDI